MWVRTRWVRTRWWERGEWEWGGWGRQKPYCPYISCPAARFHPLQMPSNWEDAYPSPSLFRNERWLDGFIQISYCVLLEIRPADYILLTFLKFVFIQSYLFAICLAHPPPQRWCIKMLPENRLPWFQVGREKALKIQGSFPHTSLYKQLSPAFDGKFLLPMVSTPHIQQFMPFI